MPDDVCPGQLKANCEIVLASGRRIDTIEGTLLGSEKTPENEFSNEDEILTDVLENSAVNIETNLLDVSRNGLLTSVNTEPFHFYWRRLFTQSHSFQVNVCNSTFQ